MIQMNIFDVCMLLADKECITVNHSLKEQVNLWSQI